MTGDQPGPIVPPGWRLVDGTLDGRLLEGFGPTGRTLVVEWRDVDVDGRAWRHVTVSIPTILGRRPDLPDWLELDFVRTQIIGADVEAYQVHPAGFTVPGEIHLFACLESRAGILPTIIRPNGSHQEAHDGTDT